MSQNNGDGIKYPQLTLGGVTYMVMFTRGGMLYRLGNTNTTFADLGAPGAKRFTALVDILHAALFGQFHGTQEQLAELLISEDKVQAASVALADAMGKVFPPPTAAAVATEAPAAEVPLQ